MTHPIGEIAIGITVVLALGASTLLVMPQSRPDAPGERLLLDAQVPEAARAEPLTDAERVARLERQLAGLAAQHSALREQVLALAAEIADAERRDRGSAPR